MAEITLEGVCTKLLDARKNGKVFVSRALTPEEKTFFIRTTAFKREKVHEIAKKMGYPAFYFVRIAQNTKEFKTKYGKITGSCNEELQEMLNHLQKKTGLNQAELIKLNTDYTFSEIEAGEFIDGKWKPKNLIRIFRDHD